MTNKYPDSEQIWERGWDGHELAQMVRMSKLSFPEKIKWLEEAQELMEKLKAQDEKTGIREQLGVGIRGLRVKGVKD